VPTPASLDTDGLDLDADVLEKLLRVDADAWRQELPQIEEHFASLGERLPEAMHEELRELEKRLTD
jgi:phosphoenolpyruvate carboxykinase (GTP)